MNPPVRDDAQSAAPYLDALAAYALRDPARFHVPGHKGGRGADPELRALLGPFAFLCDVTRDIAGIDAGARPTPFDQAEQLAAELHGAARTWFLTNGATQGNHALALAYTAGAAVAVERNAHASVLDGLVMSGGMPVDLMPSHVREHGVPGVVSPQCIAEVLRARPEVSVVFMTAPTYFGMTPDVAACATVAHEHGAALVVDQSWGPHLGLHPDLPPSALACGADAVLTSTHKHVGSLGQSAMLHLARDSRLPHDRLERTVRLVRSTSASSLLLGSLDAARRRVALDGAALLDGTLATIRRLHAAVDAVPGCEVADFSAIEGVAAIDPLRTFVDVRGTGMSGHTVAGRVRDAFGINVELTTGAGFLLVHGFDEPPALTERCAEALRAVVADAGPLPPPADVRPPDTPPTPGERVLTPREAFLAPLRRVDAPDAVGEVSAELIAGYPPGIPTLVPGERITAAAIEHLASLFDGGVRLHGASDATLATVLVVDG